MAHDPWIDVEDELADVLAHVIEGVDVVFVRLGGSRNRERDVVATVVIAHEAALLVVSLWSSGTRRVKWFPDGRVVPRQRHLQVARLGHLHLVIHAILGAVLANVEEQLNLFANQGELALLAWLLEAGKVVVAEHLNLLVLLRLSVHRVDQKDR